MANKKEQGPGALNQEFSRYEQVEKTQSYRLSEGNDEAFDEDFTIQVCDMGLYWQGDEAARQEFAEQLGSAMEEIGFAILINHGFYPV